ncbi:MAG: Zn-dependent hydrolase [Candidatus Methylomirabilales bacterium]
MEVNFARLKRDLAALAGIGRMPTGGVSRPSWSDADAEARRWLLQRLREAGLEARVDQAGNIFGRWQPGSPVVLTGSHIDSVPDGGTLDGALGVLAALEALRRVKEERLALRCPLELVAFSDEEGAFGGFFGSFAFTGALAAEAVPAMRNAEGVSIVKAMARHGLNALHAPAAARDPRDLCAYVELHIEQGRVLEAAGVPIGIVDDIVGIRRYAVRFIGRADHAGTTPLAERKDALLGAADLALRARQLVLARGTPASRVTVGTLRLAPGASNIVPAEALLSLELREVAAERLRGLAEASLALARTIAGEWGLEVVIEPVLAIEPVAMAPEVKAAIAASAEERGLRTLHLPAMAGHDAQVVGRVAKAGMLFVPSREGRSHSPMEFTADEDLEHGANVLLSTLLRLAAR